jgi:hypothetical protein
VLGGSMHVHVVDFVDVGTHAIQVCDLNSTHVGCLEL